MARHRETLNPRHTVKKRVNHQDADFARYKFTASQEVKEWLANSTTAHWYFLPVDKQAIYRKDPPSIEVEFCNPRDAVMFKLAWGGNI